MSQIKVYLTFNGNCREAMHFYQEILGGELMFQTVGETPISDQMPPQMKDSILHSTLTNGKLEILASDMVGEKGLIHGTAISMMLDCGSEEEIRKFYENLSEGGTATHPIETTFWGALFGDLTDKYGHQWLLHYDQGSLKV